MEKLEDRVLRDYVRHRVTINQIEVMEIDNKGVLSIPEKTIIEKLQGRFKLKINDKLPMHTKIEKYANESLAFYLHKKRNFIDKLKHLHNEQVKSQRFTSIEALRASLKGGTNRFSAFYPSSPES